MATSPLLEPRTVAPSRWALLLLLMLFVILQITHAWVVDDAYITLRTVDNFVNGLGLRWNPEERVQSYTHPLWMFALSAVYFVTREAFFSTLLLSFVTSLLAILVVVRWLSSEETGYKPVLFLAVLLGSKAFLDYSSSGLENPLTHLLLALFFTRWLDARVPTDARRSATIMFGLAALGFVNRMDSILFFAPACVLALFEARGQLKATLLGAVSGAAPALAWVAFSLFYYGSVVPNTAIAKLGGPRVTKLECLRAGIVYFGDSAMTDPLTLTGCSLAIALAIASRQPRVISAAAGVLLYLLYILTTGAIGTHMSGRFFSGALFLSALLLACEARHALVAAGATGLTALFMAASPVSPLRVGFDSYGKTSGIRPVDTIIDTRHYVLDEGAALLNLVPSEALPRHPWYRAGLEFRDSPQHVHLGGLVVSLAIGYSGFAAGPTHYFIDVLGLADPLMARIPMPAGGSFRPGHFFRNVPDGYVESVENGDNRIRDPDLKRYYEPIRLITRGPLFSAARVGEIVSFNLGRYDKFLDAFARRHQLRSR